MTAAKCAIPAAARFPTPTCPIHIVRTGRQLTRRVVAIVPAPPHTVLQARRGQPAYGEPKLAGAQPQRLQWCCRRHRKATTASAYRSSTRRRATSRSGNKTSVRALNLPESLADDPARLQTKYGPSTVAFATKLQFAAMRIARAICRCSSIPMGSWPRGQWCWRYRAGPTKRFLAVSFKDLWTRPRGPM